MRFIFASELGASRDQMVVANGLATNPVAASTVAIALLLIVGVGQASPTSVQSPKLHGWTYQWTNATASYCGDLHLRNRFSFVVSSGQGKFSGSARSKTCLHKYGSSSVDDAGVFGAAVIAINVSIPAGHHSVVSTWSYNVSYNLTARESGGCRETHYYQHIDPSNGSYDYNWTAGGCWTDAAALFAIYPMYVQDVTNGSVVWVSGERGGNLYDSIEAYETIDYGCYGPGYTGSVYCFNSNSTSGSGTLYGSGPVYNGTAEEWFNGTYNASHSYELYFIVRIGAGTDAFGFPHASAFASVNAASSGSSFSLTRVFVH